MKYHLWNKIFMRKVFRLSNYRYFVIQFIFNISTFQLWKIEKDNDGTQEYVGVLRFP